MRWIVMSLTAKVVGIRAAPLPGSGHCRRSYRAAGAMTNPRRLGRSPLLVDADDEVAFEDLRARNAQFLGWVELAQHQRIRVPADELLDQHRLALFVDDDVAAAGRRLEWVDVQQPALLVARLHAVADHIDRVSAAHADEIG